MARVSVLTGNRRIGKTTVCRETVALARAQGDECGGILTVARDGARDVYDVRTGEVRRLTQPPDAQPAVVQGRFRFNPETLSWAKEVLSQSVPCDLLVIDEIGPLEIERGAGWVTAFEVLHSRAFALAVVVVRPELVARAQLRLPGFAPTVLTATRDNRDSLPAVLIEMLNQET